MIFIKKNWQKWFRDEKTVDDFFAITGKIGKKIANRTTVRFERDGQSFYIKCHEGCGWGEIMKNLLRGQLPVLGAENEWRALHRLQQLNIPTMTAVGFGKEGLNPARQRSFIITEDLGPAVSLETLTRQWNASPPSPAYKRKLIQQVAMIAQTIHTHGLNHRDFYLCHFLIPQPSPHEESKSIANINIHLIDLHRAQLRSHTGQRWIIKDLAGLLFSSMHIGLTTNDKRRFVTHYLGIPFRQLKQTDLEFWSKIEAKAKILYKQHNS